MSFANQFDVDIYAKEEAQEAAAMNKSLYQPMKSWYQILSSTFREKYGPFPMFWQDMQLWSNFKTVKKIYLLSSDLKSNGKEYDIDELDRSIEPSGNEIEATNSSDPTTANPKATRETSAEAKENNSEAKENDAQEERARKRRSRWGESATNISSDSGPTPSSVTEPSNTSSVPPGDIKIEDDATKKPRKSRFTVNENAVLDRPVAPLVLTQESIQQSLILQMQLKQINDRFPNIASEALAIEADPNRSPSPPPRYDVAGKRTNTREMRMRESLTEERTSIIENLLKLNPLYQPPADFVRSKPVRRLFIPAKEHPSYNFIGLVIGPRGNTQKRLEKETGCKISIRGKGSLKDGSKGRAKQPDEDMELHVHITGDDEDRVILAEKLVKELLEPIDDDKNEHKQKQLRELALINGTLKEDEFCPVCGERGHRQFECPHRAKTFKAAGVVCSICGDLSHPTRDCPLKQDAPTNEVALDTEYMSFMSELGGKGPAGTAPPGATTSTPAIPAPSAGFEVPIDGDKITSGRSETPSVNNSETTSGKKQTVISVSFVDMMAATRPPQAPMAVPMPSMAMSASAIPGGAYSSVPGAAPMQMPPGQAYYGMPPQGYPQAAYPQAAYPQAYQQTYQQQYQQAYPQAAYPQAYQQQYSYGYYPTAYGAAPQGYDTTAPYTGVMPVDPSVAASAAPSAYFPAADGSIAPQPNIQ